MMLTALAQRRRGAPSVATGC